MDPNVIAELLNRYTRHPKQKRHDYISLALIDALADHFAAEQLELSRIGNYVMAPAFDRAEFARIATGSATPPAPESTR